MASRILVYKDLGSEFVEVLQRAITVSLRSLGKNQVKVDLVEAAAITSTDAWKKDTLAFVLPGGRDLPYIEKLKGHGDESLKDFVSNGGSFLGICAGAYYSSRYCDFQKGTEMEVCGERELSLLPVTAKGCVYPGFHYKSSAGARMVGLKLSREIQSDKSMSMVEKVKAYCHGGCEFILDKEGSDDVKVLAHYSDFEDKIAVVFRKYGQGNVILTGIHPEMDYQYLNKRDYEDSMWNQMTKFAEAQRSFLAALLNILV